MGETLDASRDQDTGEAFFDDDGDLHLYGATLWADNGGLIDLDNGGLKRRVISTAVDLTLTAAQSGAVVVCTGADKTITLPSTSDGLEFYIVVGAVSVTTGLSVSPAAADQLIGNGFTAADDKDAINTQATEVVGDSLHLVGDGSAGWYIIDAKGTWAREA